MQNDVSPAGQNEVAGKPVRSLSWYDYLWSVMPMTLLIEGGKFGLAGGLLAVLVGLTMSYLNVRILKEPRGMLIRYFMALLSTLAAFVFFAILITLFQAKTGQL